LYKTKTCKIFTCFSFLVEYCDEKLKKDKRKHLHETNVNVIILMKMSDISLE